MKLYLLNAEGTDLFKIGITKGKVSKRILELQTGNPNIISEIYSIESEHASTLEKTLHRHFSAYHQSGEWFLFSDISIEEIKEKIKNFNNIVKSIKNEEEGNLD